MIDQLAELLAISIKVCLLYDLVIPFLDIYQREVKTYALAKTCTQMFMKVLSAVGKTKNN